MLKTLENFKSTAAPFQIQSYQVSTDPQNKNNSGQKLDGSFSPQLYLYSINFSLILSFFVISVY
jgi:hypothetical protein